jgi:hypothetical protein
MQQGCRGRGWGALAWRWHTQGSSNLLSRIRIKMEALGREERAQALDLREAFHFSKWPTISWGRWGSIYSPHLKKSYWGVFHRTSPLRPRNKSGGHLWSPAKSFWKPITDQISPVHRTSPEEVFGIYFGASGIWSLTGLVQLTGQVLWGSLESGPEPLEFGGFTRQVWWNLEIWEFEWKMPRPFPEFFQCVPLYSTAFLWLK